MKSISTQKIQWPLWSSGLANCAVEGGRRVVSGITSNRPLISYVTVVRNGEKTLARTIESVKRQTYQNIEHIILDGASEDGTMDIVRSAAPNLEYFASESDKGIYDGLNKAVPLARGDYICALNADDWLEPRASELVYEAVKESKADLLMFSAQVNTGAKTMQWQPAPVDFTAYFRGANCCHNAIYASRSAYETSGPYDTSFKIAGDFAWIMQCFDAGLSIRRFSEVTTNFSLGGVSGDGGRHRQESNRIAHNRFPFLSEDECRTLQVIFYQWRERISEDELFGIQVEEVLSELSEKYSEYPEFLDAILSTAPPSFARRVLRKIRMILHC